jgi:hypothetical protein
LSSIEDVLSGGTANDLGTALAVRGNGVYVVGGIVNNAANANAVIFGGSGTTAGTVPVAGIAAAADLDLTLAKYTHQGNTGALNWVQVGGGPEWPAGLRGWTHHLERRLRPYHGR